MKIRAGSALDNLMTLAVTAMHYISTKFGVDSSSCFLFTVWTSDIPQSQMPLTTLITLPTPRLPLAWVITKKLKQSYQHADTLSLTLTFNLLTSGSMQCMPRACYGQY